MHVGTHARAHTHRLPGPVFCLLIVPPMPLLLAPQSPCPSHHELLPVPDTQDTLYLGLTGSQGGRFLLHTQVSPKMPPLQRSLPHHCLFKFHPKLTLRQESGCQQLVRKVTPEHSEGVGKQPERKGKVTSVCSCDGTGCPQDSPPVTSGCSLRGVTEAPHLFCVCISSKRLFKSL